MNWDQVPNGALVRFHGMIQDVQDPEYYEGVFQESDGSGAPPRLVPAKYRDGITPVAGRDYASTGRHIWQRIPVVWLLLWYRFSRIA